MNVTYPKVFPCTWSIKQSNKRYSLQRRKENRETWRLHRHWIQMMGRLSAEPHGDEVVVLGFLSCRKMKSEQQGGLHCMSLCSLSSSFPRMIDLISFFQSKKNHWWIHNPINIQFYSICVILEKNPDVRVLHWFHKNDQIYKNETRT